MKGFDDKQFDLAIVDPPYFSGPEKRMFYGNKISTTNIKRIDYPVTESWEVPAEEYFNQLFRVSKHQIIWGCNYYQYPFGSGRIVWDKVNGKTSFSDCEIAYCSLHDSVRLIRYMWNGMMQGKSIEQGHIMKSDKSKNEKKIHPTQKPVLLYKWTLNQYAQTGWKILDTHLGSGSSRIAAYDLGFDFTGIELSKVHYSNQEKRFEQHKRQLTIQY